MSARLLAVSQLISGAILMGYLVAGLFFLRFWRDTRDRLFLIFAVAFVILGAQRLALALAREMLETQTGLYLIRLFAFLLILGAIVDKNRSRV
jgi:amino acid transporter